MGPSPLVRPRPPRPRVGATPWVRRLASRARARVHRARPPPLTQSRQLWRSRLHRPQRSGVQCIRRSGRIETARIFGAGEERKIALAGHATQCPHRVVSVTIATRDPDFVIHPLLTTGLPGRATNRPPQARQTRPLSQELRTSPALGPRPRASRPRVGSKRARGAAGPKIEQHFGPTKSRTQPEFRPPSALASCRPRPAKATQTSPEARDVVAKFSRGEGADPRRTHDPIATNRG